MQKEEERRKQEYEHMLLLERRKMLPKGTMMKLQKQISKMSGADSTSMQMRESGTL